MPENSRFMFVASMDVDEDKEDLFNEVYDTEHIPFLSQVPGVISIRRYVKQELEMIIGGERQRIASANEPKYHATYELESAEVLVSPEWEAAVDRGRWAAEVRPFTRNRRHVLQKIISS